MKQSNQIDSSMGGGKANIDSKMAQATFMLENEVIDDKELYHFDEGENDKLFDNKPWKKK